jgi:hypothetical protein
MTYTARLGRSRDQGKSGVWGVGVVRGLDGCWDKEVGSVVLRSVINGAKREMGGGWGAFRARA